LGEKRGCCFHEEGEAPDEILHRTKNPPLFEGSLSSPLRGKGKQLFPSFRLETKGERWGKTFFAVGDSKRSVREGCPVQVLRGRVRGRESLRVLS